MASTLVIYATAVGSFFVLCGIAFYTWLQCRKKPAKPINEALRPPPPPPHHARYSYTMAPVPTSSGIANATSDLVVRVADYGGGGGGGGQGLALRGLTNDQRDVIIVMSLLLAAMCAFVGGLYLYVRLTGRWW
ncbi:hypothetical protein F4809DRAFT_638345 [Biscogniauxia mediterranea]|nr:hypothetical protein F4809DRAFT_638345 [Biscogniauxia mediterranea]